MDLLPYKLARDHAAAMPNHDDTMAEFFDCYNDLLKMVETYQKGPERLLLIQTAAAVACGYMADGSFLQLDSNAAKLCVQSARNIIDAVDFK